MSEVQAGIYDARFKRCREAGLSVDGAITEITDQYLDSKPARRSKKNPIKASDRDTAFWTSDFLAQLTSDICASESFVLALARYFAQDAVSNQSLLLRIAALVPSAVRRAIRYSRLVMRPDSKRWREVEALADSDPDQFGALVAICRRFHIAHQDRLSLLEESRSPLTRLTPLELLSYSSLYAFEYLIPTEKVLGQGAGSDNEMEDHWYAFNDILQWKLESFDCSALNLSVADIGRSLQQHMSPFLFPSPEHSGQHLAIYQSFVQFVAAQLEYNSFMSRSIDAFCYDDSIRFKLVGNDLTIVEVDVEERQRWKRGGEKLARLHQYWYYRAVAEFSRSGMEGKVIGLPDNHERNQAAVIKTLRIQLQLTEVYGLSDHLLTDSGLRVDLYQALLSMELMTAFYNAAFIEPFNRYLDETGHWCKALCLLAIEGLQDGMQNRFPITFSDRKEKIEAIRSWTVNEALPKGSLKAAEAILDFWTSDLKERAAQLRDKRHGPIPELHERPVLKMGRFLFQLPWLMAFQNNSTAALNNLRRIGRRRQETRDETERIETRLAEQFAARGFRVVANYQPPKTDDDDPGEIDLICQRDGCLLVLEVKSTFLRSSQFDAWLHKTQTLRKAGTQVKRKIEAVTEVLKTDMTLATRLGLEHGADGLEIHGWIVDTSIEHDHERFSGFLKVSLEEVLIALWDNAHYLNDPAGIFRNPPVLAAKPAEAGQEFGSLYQNGISGRDFVNAVEQETVWNAAS
ncbi:YraN family protein [Marinobacterium sedimentorum]|uniref:YraN family protein n=1 Tax=Marinobacterium sedimentorum TaxID=2927804 RepID=UPI0020C71F55|nr:YraN family protein [Marinobacterium sedimentorum]MCP8687124.1 YraN family protein [Marinobacterium sedimentorum]